METTRKRRWWQWQIGIRDVIWLTIVVAMALGWWVRERRLQPFQQENQRLRGTIDRSLDAYKWILEKDGYHIEEWKFGRFYMISPGLSAYSLDDDGRTFQRRGYGLGFPYPPEMFDNPQTERIAELRRELSDAKAEAQYLRKQLNSGSSPPP